MTTFFVGQRVRIKWVHKPKNKHLVGAETTVTRFVESKKWGVGVELSIDAGNGEWYLIDQLEPATDSNDLVSWESMRDLWVPEHLRVAA